MIFYVQNVESKLIITLWFAAVALMYRAFIISSFPKPLLKVIHSISDSFQLGWRGYQQPRSNSDRLTNELEVVCHCVPIAHSS